jgi:UDP-N-acetylglucosamine 2-epimerase
MKKEELYIKGTRDELIRRRNVFAELNNEKTMMIKTAFTYRHKYLPSLTVAVASMLHSFVLV